MATPSVLGSDLTVLTLRTLCILALCSGLLASVFLSCSVKARRKVQDGLTKFATKVRAAKPQATSPWSCMGEITPRSTNHLLVKPQRIYKFNPKYFLTMGLRKTTINEIIQVDKLHSSRLCARGEIAEDTPSALACYDSALPALHELYEFLFSHLLPSRYPTVYRLEPQIKAVRNLITDELIPLLPSSDRRETLSLINRNVDEDFLLMLPAPDGDGYSLQAHVWCYPVGFTAASKLGLKLREAHAPIPGYKAKLEMSMDRYFANLQPGDIRNRTSWAVAANDDLCVKGEYHFYEGQEVREKEFDVESAFVRCEQQTLFALPKSGARVLAVHLYLYPLREIRDVGLGEDMVAAIDGLREGNVPGFWRYKRVPLWGDKVKDFLRAKD